MVASIDRVMATRDPSIVAARWLVGVSAGVVAAFVVATLLAQHVQGAIVVRSDELVANAMPSVKVLSTTRGNLHAMMRDIERGVANAQNLRELEVTADSDLRDIDGEIASYKELPFFPHEQALFAQVNDALASLAATYGAWKVTPGPSTLAALRADATLVDEALERVITFDADQGQRLGLEIVRIRAGSVGLVALVDGVAVLLAAGVVVLAARQLRRAARARRLDDEARDERESQLRERNEALGQFAGRVAHDVLSPLSSTMFALDHLRYACQQSKTTEHSVERGVAGIRRVQVLVDGLLQFARAGGKPEANAKAELEPVLQDLVDDLQTQAKEQEITLSLKPLPVGAVACSPGVLTSIVVNLVQNALKYMGDARERRVTVAVYEVARSWRIEVEDTGPGIPEDELRHIFEPYVQLARAGNGIGLGLATVDRLVRAHNGTIGVRSHVGKGSTFWFELPKLALPERSVAVSSIDAVHV